MRYTRTVNIYRFIALLLAVALFAVFVELGRMDVVTDNEGQRAAPPAEMVRSDHYLIPTINGQDYLAKPPLLYWVIAGVYQASGHITPFLARIPTALSAVAMVLLVYLLTRKHAGEMPARWGALALLACPYFLERSRWAELDVPLVLACFLMIMAFRAALCATCPKHATARAVYAGIALGAAIMLKGPVPLLFLWAATVALLLLSDEGRPIPFKTLLQWTAGLALLEAATRLTELTLQHALGFPLALILALTVWTVYALRHAAHPGRALGLTALTVGVGILVAAPWAALVVITKGWPYIHNLLHEQVVERTYTASRINSGSPFYFIQALPAMLAPWGFLLPLHFSPTQWRAENAFYRFCVLSAWLSVLVFSLIAGKEYEYILPAVPFLLIATGYHLDELPAGLRTHWMNLWGRWWQRIVAALLLATALGVAGYTTVAEPHALLLVELWLLAALSVAAAIHSTRLPIRRTACIFVMALTAILAVLLQRSYHYTGLNSPKELAQLTGDLVRAGHHVEAAKVYPAFAFYAETPIPVEIDPDIVKTKLKGETPYYYLTRLKFVEDTTGREQIGEVLTQPYTSKDLVLVGNRPLPEDFGR